jgi:hypothetical protein
MTWDDELESLTNAVYETFGKQAFEEAATRALETARRECRPLPAGHFAADLLADALDGDDAVTFTGFYDALRLELRRVMTSH